MYFYHKKPDSGGGFATIQSVISGSICDLWAGEETSYSGTGTDWANLIAVPSDGSTQASNDFTIDDLVSGGGVTFNTDHFVPNGVNEALEMTGAMTTFWEEIHHSTSGKQWFVAFYGDIPLTSSVALLDQTNQSSTNNGLHIISFTSGAGNIFQANGSDNAFASMPAGTITTGKKLTLFTYDFDTSSLVIYHNGVKTSLTLTYGTASDPATFKPRFGLMNNNALDYSANTEIYGIGYGDTFVNDTEAANLKTLYEGR